MLHALRSLAILLLLLAGAAGATETKPFAREDMASDAVRLTETLRVATAAIGAQVKGKTPQQLLTDAARAVMGSNFGDAEKLAGAAIIAAPKDPANWLAYAGIAAAADDAKANDRYEMVTQRRDRGLCRLSAFDDAGRAGRGARRARRSARAPRSNGAPPSTP